MALQNYTFSLDNDDVEEIKKLTDNVSLFIRDAISEKLKHKEKSIQQLEVEVLQKTNELKEIEDIYYDKIKSVIEHKEQLKVIELQDYEKKLQDKREKLSALLEYTKDVDFKSILNEIKDKPDLQNDNQYLMGKVVELRNKYPNIKIGLSQLRDIISSQLV